MLEALKLSELREELHVSYSQIRTYLMCPMKYYHQYVAGTEASHRPTALVFGSAIHHALAHYYRNLQVAGEKIQEGDLLGTYVDYLDEELDRPIPLLFDDPDDEGRLKDKGVALLQMFHEKADCPNVLAVEQPFAIELIDSTTGEVMEPKLVGAIDLIIEGSKRPEIVEHKTTSKRYSKWQLDLEMQPSVYKLAAEELGLGETDVRYQLLVKTKTPSLQQCSVKRSDSQIQEMAETFCAVLQAIESGHFYRNRSWACQDCPFRHACDGCS
ncbi:MAG: PD-(D/E)XK nuclease family protein [Deltaproteobacteria bacterium]|nr:PD-(D/E)XK nuclease family protein [Deltaproteobacteria bacterium]